MMISNQHKQNSTKRALKLSLYKLTPSDDIDIGVYKDAIDSVFESDDILNIALSGPYGAGKSSVLETYKKNSNKKFIHIVLTGFEKTNDDGDKNVAENTSLVEGKILNQLLHQIDNKRIPQTEFRLKKPATRSSACFLAFKITSLLALFIYQLYFPIIKSLIYGSGAKWLEIAVNDSTRIVSGLAILLVVWHLANKLIWSQWTTGILKKVIVHGNEFEINCKNDESLFDKYLNEVLYLFENAGVDGIVFEDLDRLESQEIFVRLREVNRLVNGRRHGSLKKCCKGLAPITNRLKAWLGKSNHRFCVWLSDIFFKSPKPPLRFFYLLRDDLFTNKDRTKFFDQIIPVVPIIDGSNAYEMFVRYLKEQHIFEDFEPRFLQNLSLYIDEMRLLRNIINEYLVYNHQINKTELNANKMLAIIAYKNVFPKDFSDLQLNRGFVYEVFGNFPSIIKKQKEKYDTELGEIDKNISKAGNACLTVEEIDKIMGYICRYDGRTRPFKDNESLIRAKEFATTKKQVDEQNLHDKRLELLAEKDRLEHAKLNDVLTRKNIDNVFRNIQRENAIGKTDNFDDVKSSEYFDLLKFLLRNGHIDESYAEYMTYFHPHSISQNDKMFLRAITDQKAKEHDYKLDDPETVFNRIDPLAFSQDEIINHDLLHFMLQAPNENVDVREALSSFIILLKKLKQYEFLEKHFYKHPETKEVIIEEVNKRWKTFMIGSIQSNIVSDKSIITWVQLTLDSVASDEIESFNPDNGLTTWISEHSTILKHEAKNSKKFVENLIALDTRFESLETESGSSEILKGVYHNNLYVLDLKNIQALLKAFYNEIDLTQIPQRTLTLIQSEPEQPLAKFVNNELAEVTNLILDECEQPIEDDEKQVLAVLNSETLELDTKNRYVGKLGTTIKELDSVTDKATWIALIEESKVSKTPENILTYFRHHEFNDPLCKFINTFTSDQLDFSDSELFQPEDDERKKAFLNAVVVRADMEEAQYRAILSTLNVMLTPFELTGLEKPKVDILIEAGTIGMDQKTLDHVRAHYNDCTINLIMHYFDEYLELDADKVKAGEIINILNSSLFDEEQQMKVLNLNVELISVKSIPGASDSVFAKILARHFDTDDIEHLLTQYDSLSEAKQKAVTTRLSSYRDHVISSSFTLSESFIRDMVIKTDIELSERQSWFNEFYHVITKRHQFRESLQALDLTEFDKVFTNGLPNIENNHQNQQILEFMKKQGWIKDFVERPNKPEFYRISKVEFTAPDSEALL